MDISPTDHFIFREKIFRCSVAQIDEIVQQAKEKMEAEEKEISQKLAKLEYIKLLMSSYIIRCDEVDFVIFEEIYQELVEKPWTSDDEPLFPLQTKAGFLQLMHSIFSIKG